MIAFQLDQCLDSKRFAKECHAEGLCQVQRFPSVLRNAEDPELLMTLMVQAIPLVTFDRALAHEHARFIPDNNPGIIVISNYPSPQTLTVSIAQKVLRRLAFPNGTRLRGATQLWRSLPSGCKCGTCRVENWCGMKMHPSWCSTLHHSVLIGSIPSNWTCPNNLPVCALR